MSDSYCIGNWKFSTSNKECEYKCLTTDELEDYFGEGNREGFVEEISKKCISKNGKDERNNCCNDNLKNGLSMGPKKGYPDCLGKWYFEEVEENLTGCQFQCASPLEARKILKELKNPDDFQFDF